jgi:hypothetical protein
MVGLTGNLANLLRTLALPDAVKQWSLTTLRQRLVKIGAKVVRHSPSVIFQMAEVAVPRALFRTILGTIAALRPLPPARCLGSPSRVSRRPSAGMLAPKIQGCRSEHPPPARRSTAKERANGSLPEKSLSRGLAEDYAQRRRAKSTAIWGIPVAIGDGGRVVLVTPNWPG